MKNIKLISVRFIYEIKRRKKFKNQKTNLYKIIKLKIIKNKKK